MIAVTYKIICSKILAKCNICIHYFTVCVTSF